MRRSGRGGGFTHAVLALTTALACRAQPEDPAPDPEGSQTIHAASSASTAGTAEVASRFRRPGRAVASRQVFTLELDSKAHVEATPLVAFTLRGEVEVATVEVTKERTLLWLSIRPGAKLVLQGTPAGGAATRMDAELPLPFLAEMQPDGRLAAFYFTPEPNALVVGIHQSIASSLQVAIADGEPEWTAVEQDATGHYVAAYRALGAGKVSKKKVLYTSVLAATSGQKSAGAPTPKILRSEATLVVDPAGLIQRVASSEALDFSMNRMLPIQSETRIELVSKSTDVLRPSELPDWRRDLGRAKRYAADRPWTPPEQTADVDRARVDGRTFDELCQMLAETRKHSQAPASNEAESERRADVFSALQALVRLEPSVIPKMVARVKKNDPLTPEFLDALGSSGSKDGHSALIALLNAGTLDESESKSAAISLSRTPTPTAESLDGLKSMLGDKRLGTQALYGLGTSVRRLREHGDEARAGATLNVILATLGQAQTTVQRINALRAIANSGHEAAYPAVKPFLDDPAEDVRAAAVESLQLIRQAGVEETLAHYLEADVSPVVQMAAARAARLREPTDVLQRAAVQVTRSDDHPHVRLAALRVLTSWIHSRPALRVTLEEVVAKEKEDAIRREAESALAVARRAG